ncbi:cytochrome c [Erwinia amylovora]|uniref:cytochrome c n=1 Tax=Erwinia amylovora TaxID=552 RepID=UPI001443CD7B|nr:cytochrome c [Erwinia amylovora]
MKGFILQVSLACILVQSGFVPAAQNSDIIRRGEYLARAGDCTACHTATNGPLFGGGFAVSTPFGQIWAPNISSDKQFGIGSWSDDQFVAAVRDGINRNGEQLYPAMPYDSFTKIKRADVLAIKAYIVSLPGVHQPSPQTSLPFPFNQRWGLRFWKWINFDSGELREDPLQSSAWNNGRYLVEALAHCGTCHTPRNITLGMDNDNALAGGDLGGWTAFNITPHQQAGIGSWSQQQLVTYLKTGFVVEKASASGSMAEAIEHSLQYLHDSDLNDIAIYLKSVPARGNSAQIRDRSVWGRPSNVLSALRGADEETWRTQPGARVFAGNCASCHAADGSGSGKGLHAYPSLFHHTTTGAEDARNLVSVVLNGVHRHMQQGEIFMPAFAAELDDQQVADVSNFVIRQFGNPAAAGVTAKQVKALRKDAKLASPPVYMQGDTP